jgi:AcrR family transcriptional regulator
MPDPAVITTPPQATDARARLIEAAKRVYADHGFRGATTKRIAEVAGVNEVTLFRLFGSKAVLLEEATREAHAEAVRSAELPSVPVDPEAELTRWADAHLHVMREHAALIRTMMGDYVERPELGPCMTEGWDGVRAEIEGYFARLQDRGMIDRAFTPIAAAAVLMGALFSDMMGRELLPVGFPPEAAAAATYVRVVLRGVGYAPAGARTGAD